MIHSLDREPLIRQVEKNFVEQDLMIEVLLQVNIGGEESKSGTTPEELPELMEQVLASPHLKLRGLMTVPPISYGDEARRYFAKMKTLFDKMADNYKSDLQDFSVLSMGMSGDFKEAILEGATLVRVGSAIFGERIYS